MTPTQLTALIAYIDVSAHHAVIKAQPPTFEQRGTVMKLQSTYAAEAKSAAEDALRKSFETLPER